MSSHVCVWSGAGQGAQGDWGRRDDARLRAAVGLSLRFETWSALARDEGMADREAADPMVAIIGAVGPLTRRGL